MNGSPPNAGGGSVEAIFNAALELDAARRAAYLDGACGADPKLRRRVEALLRAAEANAAFLPEQPNPKLAARMATNAAVITEKPGDRIGHYTLLEQIGVGGFGVVFKAKQEQPIRRTVALKIVKLGMDTQEVIARFDAERQTLALMDHPNIARVLDAGATETGRPYFVMELVDGLSITEYCDRHCLSTRRRLVLFTQVCRAIQHAHEKGVIHRDIKPSNVLVTVQDGAAVPKVIDFGIAKATAQSFAFNTVATALGVLGTPAYMSPEQADLQRADIDTRSDIYSLGVLLYELLTGQPPFQPSALMQLALDEVLRTIREQEPPRPSTCLTKLARQKLSDTAEQRETDPAKLPNLLRGDLDCIVMKCLEKDRARRYESASTLARDVQRHLEHQPIRALPTSVIYRFQKWVRRHRFAFATGTTAFVLALAASLYWWFLPGTLNLEVSPPDAQIEIDGRDQAPGPMPRQIRLSAGVHQVRFHKTDYTNELRTVLVPRDGFASIPHFALKHDEGTLDVQSSPPGAGIEFHGIAYHGAITDRPTDTGTHDITCFDEGYFDVRHQVSIKLNERSTDRLSLEPGVNWKYESTGVQGGFFIITNTLPGEPLVIAHNELGRVLFLSAYDGKVLDKLRMPDGNGSPFTTFNLGGDLGRVLVTRLEDPQKGPLLVALVDSWPTTNLWAGKEKLLDQYNDARGVSVALVPRPAGINSLALANNDGWVRVINGHTAALEHEFLLATNPIPTGPYLCSWNLDDKTYLLALLQIPGTNALKRDEAKYEGVLTDLAGHKTLWRTDLGKADLALFVDMDHHGVPSILMWDELQWRVFDSMTGRLKFKGALPGRLSDTPLLLDVEGTGATDFVFKFKEPNLPMMAVRPVDNVVLWRGPTNVAPFGFSTRLEPSDHLLDGAIIMGLDESLVALELRSGKVRWELKSKPSRMLIDDQGGELYVTFADRRLFCLDSSGRTNWILRLAEEVDPRVILPASGGGTHGELLLSRHATIIELIHWPRRLWDATATSQLQATPLIVKDPAGRTIILQLGAWGGYAHLAGLSGINGQIIWSNQEHFAPNRSPAFGLMDSDGAMEVAIIGESRNLDQRRLFVRRAFDGKLMRDPLTSLFGWFAGGAAADFRGVGKCDIAVSTSDQPRIAVINSANGDELWYHRTEGGVERSNMGGLAVADLDGDGLPDLVATSGDGHVYALRGKDGHLFWRTSGTNYSSVSSPTIADLDSARTLQVLVTTEAGRLFVFDGANGNLLWSPEMVGGRQIAGRATVANVDGRKLILAPMGTNGVVAFDWSSRKEVWRSPKGYPVIATPVIADLAHDGRRQVVIGATTGDVIVFELVGGRTLWQEKIALKSIEADPVMTDLNNDGVDDILIASHDFHLYAINGRAVIPARAAGHSKLAK